MGVGLYQWPILARESPRVVYFLPVEVRFLLAWACNSKMAWAHQKERARMGNETFPS